MLANDSPIGTSGGLSRTTRHPVARAARALEKRTPRRPESVAVSMFEPYAKYHIAGRAPVPRRSCMRRAAMVGCPRGVAPAADRARDRARHLRGADLRRRRRALLGQRSAGGRDRVGDALRRPSRTAERAAALRAAHQLLDDPRILDDPIAGRLRSEEHTS